MKKILFITSLTIFAACSSTENAKTEKTEVDSASNKETVADSIRSHPDYQKGLELVAQSDCLTCHRIDDKNVGPSYREIANKYKADKASFEMLTDKIIKGGSGNWGQVPMTPHPNLSKEDAEQMLKYIFLLKNNK